MKQWSCYAWWNIHTCPEFFLETFLILHAETKLGFITFESRLGQQIEKEA